MGNNISRRNFIQSSAAAIGTVALTQNVLADVLENGDTVAGQGATPKVFFTKDISEDGILRVYQAMMNNDKLPGNVAVKLHSGEPGGHHYPSPKLIQKLVKSVNGTIVECNTAYPGKRQDAASHLQVMHDHGFAAIAPVDIMDANGSVALKCPKGSINISDNYVGQNFKNYDSFLLFSHFKGHAMGGFGGALKNMSIGIASAEGKMWIHTAGTTHSLADFGMAFKTEQDKFLESMAEAAGSVMHTLGPKKLAYVNLMNNLSVDCDCDSSPAAPEMADIGVLASLDPVALDRACVDLIYQADKQHSAALRERIESRHGTHTLIHAAKLNLGSLNYELVNV
ncbi:DUF362 domain-containing protein [Shewanella sp.]|uniref:DUF362 domain-containing protein n=1 Tax=Shewanella sp. TaxID=50422 RepID=UPI003A96F670